MAEDYFGDVTEPSQDFFEDIKEPTPAVPASLAPPMRFVPQGEARTEPRETPGFLEGVRRGYESAVSGAAETGERAVSRLRGQPAPEPSELPPETEQLEAIKPSQALMSPLEKGLPWFGYMTGRAVPTVAGSILTGPGTLGMMAGAGITQFITDYGPRIRESMAAGMSEDEALGSALKSAGVSAAATAAAFGVPLTVLKQVLLQPSIAGGEQVIQNYLAGRPLTEGIEEAAIAGVAGAAPVVVAKAVPRFGWRRRGAEPTVDAITGEPIERVPERTAPTPVEEPKPEAEAPPAKPPAEPPPGEKPAAPVPPAAAEAEPDLFTAPVRLAGAVPRIEPPRPRIEPPPARIEPPPPAEPPRARERVPEIPEEGAPPPAAPEARGRVPEIPDYFADVGEPPAWVTERIPEERAAPPEPPRVTAEPAAPELGGVQPERIPLKPAKRQSLLDYIRERGGISTKDPMVGDARSVLGKLTPLIRKGGKPLDRLLEGAVEAGYIDDPGFRGGGERTSTIRDLLDAMDTDNRARAAGNEEGRVWARGEETAARAPTEYEAGVEAAATRIRDELAKTGLRGEGVDTEVLYDAAQSLYRREVANPLDAYDQAAVRIGERDAQRGGMRPGGEEVYPPGGERAGPGAQKAIVAPRAEPSRARPARKPARQEVPAEDLAFANDYTLREVGRPVELLDSIPLRKALAETPMPDLPEVPRRVAEFIRNRLGRLVGDTPVHFVSERDLQEIAHNINPDPRQRVNGFWTEDFDTRTGRRREAIYLNADVAWAGDQAMHAHTVLHEGIHSATQHAIDSEPRVRKAIEALMDYLRPKLKTVTGEPVYAMKDPHEFAAEVGSNRHLQEALHTLPTPSTIRAMLSWTSQKGLTAWDAMVEVTRRALGLPSAMRRPLERLMEVPSVLETSLAAVEEAMRYHARLRGIPEELPQRRAIRREDEPGIRPGERVRPSKASEEAARRGMAAAEEAGERARREAGWIPPAEERGAEGKPQLVIPGAEQRLGEALQRRAEAPLRPKAEQKPMDIGLFGDAAQQPDLFAPKGKAGPAGGPQQVSLKRLKPPGFGSKFVRWYKESFQPELISDAAMKADAAFAEYAARREGERTRIYAGGPGREAIKRERMWDKVPEKDRIEFLGQVERGELVKPQYRAAAQLYRNMLDKAYELEKTWGSKTQYVSDYFPHIWERPRGKPPIDQYIENLGPTWFQRARTFELIQEGLDAGYKLRNTNPEVLIRDRLMSGADMRERMRLLNEFKKMGLGMEVRAVNDPAALSRAGWQKVNAPNREQWFLHPDIVPGWENAVNARGYWADDSMKGDAFRAWMGFKNVWVPIKLALSGFHALHVYGINVATHLSRALHELGVDPFVSLSRGKPGKAVTDLGRAAESFARAFLPYQGLGKRARYQAMLGDNARTPEGRWAVKLMEEGGFSPMMSEQLRIDASAKLRQAARNWSPLKVPYHGVRLAIQKIQAPLFEHWIPHLKTAAYLEDAARWIRNNPELALDLVQRRVALRAIAKSMDNRFGEMFYSSLFWNRKIKDLGIAAHLSLGWNLGFVREFLGAGMEAATRPATAVGLMKPGEARLAARSATNKITFATVYMGTGAALMGLMTKLLSGEDPEGMDYIFPRVGGNNPDGSPRRLTTMWYLREIPMATKHAQEHGGGLTGWAAGLRDMWFNKMLAGPIIELARNQNYYGQQIFDPDAPAYKQMQQFFSHIAREQLSPITMSGAKRAEEAAGVEPRLLPSSKEGLLAYLGFGPAPKYAERTATQNRIAYLYREHVAPATRAYEEPEMGEQKRAAAQKVLRALEGSDRAAIATAKQEAVKAGLSARYVNELGTISSDQRMFRQLSSMAPSKAIAVLEAASPDERKRYWPYTATKAKMMWKQKHPDEKFALGGVV
jgi:hypothetical protein